MKKTLSIIVGLFMVVIPVSAHADAISDAQMISLLQQLIVVLTEQLNYLLAQRGLTNPILQIQPQATTTPSVIYTTATSTYAIPLQNAPAHDAPIPRAPAPLFDRTRPELWEAQFGKDIAAAYDGQNVIRIVTNEPINLSDIKFHFRNFPDSLDWVETPVSVQAIELNAIRTTNCSVNCDKEGYETIFTVSTPLSVDVPQRYGSNGPNNALYGPEFSVPDNSGNYSSPWQSARDITSFIYE